ncbi:MULTISPECIES: M4 family metallopeptidase [unclassified Crossiella]|uniref:M4 family metallopeptidase n=1 Tax=unclassified Crossiella TaxID=2620835 RepID=UPI001FFF9A7A|nr:MULTISPECIES: M4 family metallopeptidase [unclassified Crossiella]MCK2239039.1 M4 family metallopeptidase [Crossiella sp. S99.2]MCK2251392.1 M4 family metallopeptidase [Crossiella sp. S99.1]
MELDTTQVVIALVALIGGGIVTAIGSMLRTSFEARTAGRLIYAELTRNAAAVAFFRRSGAWPATVISYTAWDQCGKEIAQLRDNSTFEAVHRGYNALEAIQFVAADTSLDPRQKTDLINGAVLELGNGIRAIGAKARVPTARLETEIRRLSARPMTARWEMDVLEVGGAVPPALLAAIIDHAGDAETSVSRTAKPARNAANAVPRADCTVYDAAGGQPLPGRAVRTAGDPPTGDPAADETYEALVLVAEFCHEVLGRWSLDDNGMELSAVVHHADGVGNVRLQAGRVVVGDGDGLVFGRFSAAAEVVAGELWQRMPEIAALHPTGQAGALGQALRDVFGLLCAQYGADETAATADWVVGKGLLLPGVYGVGLRSLAEPGTAYDDPVLGADEQVAHLAEYLADGPAQLNSGIPGHAFYLTATELGGQSWMRAGRIWYEALTSADLPPDVDFATFARRTVDQAARIYGPGSLEHTATTGAWDTVGVPTTPA